ncbi:MAG: elongation factor G, partial [Pseudomonadota bacterium]|nr:elongation factor G [Pseudomonadota bacterium]
MASKKPSGPRCAAIVGPYLSGKTTLLESILHLCGSTNRKGSVTDGNTVGDGSPEARARNMSVEINVASAEFLGEQWTFLDSPGSVELAQEMQSSLAVADAAIVVCEPGVDKVLGLTRLLLELDSGNIPYIIFINKIDGTEAKVKETFDAIQALSERPLVLREIPTRADGKITGYVDLVSERAFAYKDGGPSDLVKIAESDTVRKNEERTVLMESLADFNDELMEQLLEDIVPATDEIYDNLTKELQDASIVPVFFGSAELDHGIKRLMKALRHETQDVSVTANRLGLDGGEAMSQVFKVYNGAQSGKLSLARVWCGSIADGTTLNGNRVSGIFKMVGQQQEKISEAVAGQVVALGRLDNIKVGDVLSPSGKAEGTVWPAALKPVYGLAIKTNKREDEVKLAGALAKVIEEDLSLTYSPNPDTGELVIRGQGETHLRIALDRLKNRNKLEVTAKLPLVAYKES